MAALSDVDRRSEWARVMGELSRDRQAISGLNKRDLLAAVNAIDDWIDTNAVAFNLSIPQPARSALTAKQKARLLTCIVRRRFEVA